MAARAYYNEIDPLKAEVLREAIKHGAIAPGDVDERSIIDVRAGDLRGYTQCHFFAGGGFWSLALRYAGWPDDRPVWTGSCPCPSFSCAGKGSGFDDPRHLWPDWFKLIRECKPPVIFGEQADDAVGFGWVDLVQTDLEAAAYSFGKIVFGAHSVGAPHIRQRLYFVGEREHAASDGLSRWGCGESIRSRGEAAWSAEQRSGIACHSPNPNGRHSSAERKGRTADGRDCPVGDGSDAQHSGCDSQGWLAALTDRNQQDIRLPDGDCAALDGSHTPQRGLPMYGSAPGDTGRPALAGESEQRSNPSGGGQPGRWIADGSEQEGGRIDTSERGGLWESPAARSDAGECLHPISPQLQGHFGDVRGWRGPGWLDPHEARSVAEAGATRGFWSDCDWWYGRDGKYRPIGPGLQPLAHGSPARVGRLRLFGDGIVVTQAQEFIEAYLLTDRAGPNTKDA